MKQFIQITMNGEKKVVNLSYIYSQIRMAEAQLLPITTDILMLKNRLMRFVKRLMKFFAEGVIL